MFKKSISAALLTWWQVLTRQRQRSVPDALWLSTLANYPFLAQRSNAELARLRELTGQFLAQKQFSGAHRFQVTDEIAVAIAAQACLPVLNRGLAPYSDFKGIVVHRGPMLARRQTVDAAGVHHFYKETLAGEAMQGGPVTLSWQDAAASSNHDLRGYNVVIHEFVHKLDMAGGTANGCPPLPSRAAKAQWQTTMQTAFDAFKDQVEMAKRFGAPAPWLDAYGATSPAEFFAVASEAYFVNPHRFADDFAEVSGLFNAYFNKKQH